MPEYNDVSAVPKNTLVSAACAAPPAVSAPSPGEPGSARAGGLTFPKVLLMITFPVIGSVLHLEGGMPVREVFGFLAGCGGIGAGVGVLATGGRRVVIGLAQAVLSASGTR